MHLAVTSLPFENNKVLCFVHFISRVSKRHFLSHSFLLVDEWTHSHLLYAFLVINDIGS
jgi:hypothetical protein